MLQCENAAAGALPAGGGQQLSLHRDVGCAVAVGVERSATLGGSVSVDAAVAGGGLFRSVAGRRVCNIAAGGGAQGSADLCDRH